MIKVRCSICGRILAGRVPRGGSGDHAFPWKHHDLDGKLCKGRFRDVPIMTWKTY